MAAVLLSATVFAQTPDKMSYQAVVRNANNNVVANQAVGMQISIVQGSTNGSAIYAETQNPTTNTNGLISIEIGTGTTSDDFSSIDWANGPFYIKTETDPTGGSNYTITGTSQLMSVPYALYAKTSGSSIPGPAGTNGLDGIDGINGTNGADGADGAAGATGPQGPTGAEGAAGPTGATGPQGLIGLTGATGPQGVAGADGATGSQGVAGADGVGIAQTLSQSGNTVTLSDGGGSATFTDTNLDAAGVTALGFTSGAHTTKYTDAEAVTAVGAHTVDTDTQLDAAGVTALGFVAGAITSEVDGSITNEIQSLSVSSVGDTLILSNSNYVIVPGISIANYIGVPATGPAVVGDFRDGGIVFWVDPSDNTHGMICAPLDQSAIASWGCDASNGYPALDTLIGTGDSNTIYIEAGCTSTGGAADICANLFLNGFSDWFLPSIGALDEMYTQKAIIDATAALNGGIAFSASLYWSSSIYVDSSYGWVGGSDGDEAWIKSFSSGSKGPHISTNIWRVRAVKKF